MSSHLINHAKTIGHQAKWHLQKSQQATISGLISHGIFLFLKDGAIVFITSDPYRGPLTINLEPGASLPKEGNPGDSVLIHPGQIVFPDQILQFDHTTQLWKPAPFTIHANGLEAILKRAQRLVSLIPQSREDGIFGDILPIILNPVSSWEEKQLLLQKGLNLEDGDGQKKRLEDVLLPWLGRGRGLTPAGDDFLCGFLLAHSHLFNAPPLDRRELAAQAKNRTTALSSSLIECAAQGTADERLVSTLYYLAYGEGSPEQHKEELLSYGSSSGIDTLAGMLTALFMPTFS
ncbi:MAG: DUF2877 domain-containing protein [Pelolinea sp.]|jgi:hypothetical protein|nr:DUF2877 domain-containing protein [Pelolinea sp.]